MPPNHNFKKKWYRGSQQKAGIGKVETYLYPTLQLGRIAVIN